MQCVAFDFDGTLVNLFSKNRINELSKALKDMLKKEGYGVFCDEPFDDPFDIFTKNYIINRFSDNEKEKLLMLSHKLISEYEAVYLEKCEFIEGVSELFSEIRKSNINIAVVTNNNQETVQSFMSKKTGQNIPVFGRRKDTLCFMKPNPHLLYELSAHFECASDDILLIGDSKTDLKCAENMGCKFVAMAFRDNKHEQFLQAGLDEKNIFSNYGELLTERVQIWL